MAGPLPVLVCGQDVYQNKWDEILFLLTSARHFNGTKTKNATKTKHVPDMFYGRYFFFFFCYNCSRWLCKITAVWMSTSDSSLLEGVCCILSKFSCNCHGWIHILTGTCVSVNCIPKSLFTISQKCGASFLAPDKSVLFCFLNSPIHNLAFSD